MASAAVPPAGVAVVAFIIAITAVIATAIIINCVNEDNDGFSTVVSSRCVVPLS